MKTRPKPRAKAKKRKGARARKRQRAFCVSCGDELEAFCFTPKAADVVALQAGALRCKLTGVSGGKRCAKVYIAQGDRVPASMIVAPSGMSKKSVEALRKRVLARIRKEAKT
jgi:hypothetical protein